MLICKRKINFILTLTSSTSHFLLKILQKKKKKKSRLVILGNLRLPGHTHLKRWSQLEEIFAVYLQAKNQLHLSHFPWDIAKILQTYYFGYFGHASLRTPKMILLTYRKRSCLPAGKESLSSPTLFWRYCKLQRHANFLFRVLWACLGTETQNDSINLYKTSIFICMPKRNFIFGYFGHA